jgi:UDP-N-acetylmuramoyl-L-alanyl-D-glutamate--2,6-diaminopimelate ligase
VTPPATTVQSLAEAIPGATLAGPRGVSISGVAYDSRLVRPGFLFAALPGADLDGHDFVPDAINRGAAALLVQRPVATPLPQIVTSNSRAALAYLAAAFFAHPSHEIGVIGITGTDGKTTTSFILDHLLRSLGTKTGLIGTVAIRVGEWEDLHSSRQTTPESSDVQRYLRQMVSTGVDWAILEATSHGLAMHRLDHVRFGIGAVTNITHEHLDYHGSVEGYRRAKAILLQRVAETSGVVVLNADDPGTQAIESLAGDAQVIRYGVADRMATVNANRIRSGPSGSQFALTFDGHAPIEVLLPLIGEFNIYNALCAIAIALAAGFELDAIASAIATTPPVPGRMAVVDAGQSFSVVVDYAHTPDSMEKVLNLLRGLHPDGRLIVVFGSAGERDVEKRPLQGAVAARFADISVVTSEDPRFEDADEIIAQITAGAEAAGAIPGRSLFHCSDRSEAIALAFSLAGRGDCVLLAGKGHEGSIIWGREKRPWDEATVARELLAELSQQSSRV